ncbi:tRNA (N(6)-L-threonylcarbamoyladenosine(37)-C(2))-methylthiotransferase MtaB [Aliifodinibius sp. S!AR15-10]|uniref:tRNA (N(6)-L-threonylcarbamoyladenosine(37)-C(2))- methylthiotransferase MtaB n=1 Tax=Aliifodinibius sp. S!AR15-10 TaxID=2950437 RepID=UPI00285A39C1|nr:tRNA (N(6)-L-threonylcarbamoyladenosine(37)-C(2))-methylthiotransferase MtaB [Aliifodinibius sp. S!AR15-10]MDR8392366.1 tRNA (N(6)-L-threonylcarbamoyladenosine(37)-C(2))-methylthiotransferase MtaB [Aliifodinibius sp. S!AR15-10]
MKKVAFKTLGCKLNYSETLTIQRDFANEGYQITDFDEQADIYVINTCSVTEGANSTCRKTVRRALRRNPEAFVAVVGCYAQLEPDEIAEIDGVDTVLGAKNKFNLLELFDDFEKRVEPVVYNSDVNEAVDFHNAFSADDRTRAFLKVQDGCSYNCSFCTIPLARGESRSPEIATVVQNANHLVDDGFKEIVITGVNAGDFGRGTEENFFMLLQALETVDGLERIRFSSVEPNLMHEEIIGFTAESDKIQPHFHIPLQSGSDKMLGLMRRRYQSDLYRKRVELIKELMPDACIGVDVITGHPGETDELFQESFDFVDSLPVSYLHVFTYSERPNTHALNIEPVVQNSVRKERTHKFRCLSKKKRYNFDTQFSGEVRPVLFEGSNRNGAMLGWTDNYVRVGIPYNPQYENKILPVRLGARSNEGYLIGTLTEDAKEEERAIAELTA